MFSKSLLALATLLVSGVSADPRDLGTVLAGNKDLSTFYSLIQKYPDVLLQLPSYAGVTIVAPSNEAFKNIPYTALNGVWDPNNKATTVPLLQYHILIGTVATAGLDTGPTYVRTTLLKSPKYTNVTFGQNVLIAKQPGDTVVFTTSMGTRCTLQEGDIGFQGGLVQVVDNLLIPPSRIENTTEAFNVPNFLGSLYASKLMPKVSDEQNITVFAPVDSAFASVGGSLKHLDAKALARVMGYHIVPNQVLVSSSLTNNTRLETLAKNAAGTAPESLVIRQSGNNKYVNSAQIVQPDILLANGIMHLISNVLNPDADAAIPNPTAVTQAPVFPVSTARNPFTSDLPCTVSCPVTTTAADTTTEAAETSTSTSIFTTKSKAAAGAMATANIRAAGAALGLLGAGMML
ncbi:fasciclin domain-containing protein [Trichoderma breve]|uniref:Fasciclin domain-containing protein n=1 Tax=Trichoderma breve TaxID=2034170 RepID=A0A9W9B796_9HYPO|nr:fasciclin domain-containing protein [Trichoderma breve]KAJ4857264.1 fasciclin domain-containing protein [Trichoderma breve]